MRESGHSYRKMPASLRPQSLSSCRRKCGQDGPSVRCVLGMRWIGRYLSKHVMPISAGPRLHLWSQHLAFQPSLCSTGELMSGHFLLPQNSGDTQTAATEAQPAFAGALLCFQPHTTHLKLYPHLSFWLWQTSGEIPLSMGLTLGRKKKAFKVICILWNEQIMNVSILVGCCLQL